MSSVQNTKKILIGYIPLVDPSDLINKPGDYLSVDSLDNLQLEPAMVEAVGWVSNAEDPKEIAPVFVMDNADRVREHLDFWCEGNYGRFTLHAVQREDGYALALIPDPQQSIMRWKTARMAYHEEAIVDTDFVVYYRYLGVFCPGNRLQTLKERLGDQIMLGFVNTEFHSDVNKISYVGPFKLTVGEDRHLSELFPESTTNAV